MITSQSTILSSAQNAVQSQVEFIETLVNSSKPENDGLFNGNLSRALFYTYLYKYLGNYKYKVKAENILEEILARLKNKTSSLDKNISVYGGLSGLLWMLHVLKKEKLIDADNLGLFTPLDAIICDVIALQLQDDNLDFLHSSIGALAYLADCVEEKPSLKSLLELYVLKLNKKIKVHNKGAYLQNHFIFKTFGTVSKEDVNLGLAHGLSAILLVLIQISSKGIAQETSKNIIEEGIGFILDAMEPANFDHLDASIFPSNIILNLPRKDSANQRFYNRRMGWCYGDLNQVLLLYKAGFLLSRPDWVSIADEVGDFTLRKKGTEGTRIEDCYLCHGSSGVAQFYHSLHAVSKKSQYLSGYEHWIDKTVSYLDQLTTTMQNLPSNHSYSFLEGLVGTGLVLLSYIKRDKPQWRKFLLLNET